MPSPSSPQAQVVDALVDAMSDHRSDERVVVGEDLGVEALRTFTHLKTHCINFNGGKMAWA